MDFNDVRSVMGNGGSALMSIGYGQGDSRATDAAIQAINSKLLDISIDGARGVLFNIKGSSDMTLFEVNEAAEIIRRTVDEEANIIFGAALDDSLNNQIQITVIATGFDGQARVTPSVRTARPSAQSGASRPVEFPVRNFDKEDLDIPPFLRKANPRKN